MCVYTKIILKISAFFHSAYVECQNESKCYSVKTQSLLTKHVGVYCMCIYIYIYIYACLQCMHTTLTYTEYVDTYTYIHTCMHVYYTHVPP
jgi:hypothetical protein